MKHFRTAIEVHVCWIGLILMTLLSAPGCVPEQREPLRLLVQTDGETDPSEVASRISSHLKREVEVTPLFESVDPSDDPDQLAQMFLVIVSEGKSVSENAWDLAYGLKDATGFVQVEPDGEYSPVTEAAAERSLCFVDDSVQPPPDKAWSVEKMHVQAAWELAPRPGGRRHGEGIRICHPDTGWAAHDDLDADRLDLSSAKNLLKDGTADARDPLDYSGPLLNPGHGTGTGSVIVSEQTAGEITGVAPGARLIPIRTVKSVIQVFDSDLARAVHHAVRADCDVISMSLGGRAFFGLKAAVRNAKRNNSIVLAAAGNCVKFVVAPAAYDDCIAVAGTNSNDKPWKGSSRGRKVSVSAPGEHVWHAYRRSISDESQAEVRPGEGTSFAVASTAGVAALWLAHHNLDHDSSGFGNGFYLQDAFGALLQQSARAPDDWDELNGKYGAGVVDAEALLQQAIPDTGAVSAGRRSMPEMTPLEILANIVDRDPPELARQVARMLKTTEDELDSVLATYGSELIQLAVEDSDNFERLLDDATATPATRGAARVGLSSRASKRLQGLLQ